MKSKFSKLLMLVVVGLLLVSTACQPAATPAPTQAPAEPAQVEPTKEAPAEPPKTEPTKVEVTEAPAEEVPEEPKEPVVLRQPANEPSGFDPALGGYGYQEYVNVYETSLPPSPVEKSLHWQQKNSLSRKTDWFTLSNCVKV